jgi:hypothetical protein
VPSSNIPITRRFTLANTTVNTSAFATDDITGIAEYAVPNGAVILDVVGDVPALPAYPGVQVELYKNGIATGRLFFSQSLNPTSAGRINIGPIPLSPGRISFRCTPTLATSLRFNFLVKFDRS